MDSDYEITMTALDDDYESDRTVAQGADLHRSVTVDDLVPGQLKHLELMAHLASYSELLVVLTGPERSGKTALTEALVGLREAPEDTLTITASVMLGIPAITQAIAEHWGLGRLPDEAASQRELLMATARHHQNEGGGLLVIIDQAEQLDADTLNEIAFLAVLAPQGLSFVLSGSAGFEMNLRRSPSHAPVHIIELEALHEDDALILMHNSRRIAGLPEETDENLLSRARTTSGLAGELVEAAQQNISSITTQGASTQSIPGPTRRILLSGIVAVLIAGIWFFLADLQSKNVSETLVSETLVSESQKLDDSTDSINDRSATPVETVELMVPELKTVAESRASSQKSSTGAVDASESSSEDAVLEQQTTVAEQQTDSEVQQSAVVSKEIDDKGVDTRSDSKSELVSTATKTIVADGLELEKSDIVSEQEEVETDEIEEDLPATAAGEIATPPGTLLDQWLLEDAGFVVQLIGTSKGAGAEAFIDEWSTKVPMTLVQYKTKRQGGDWFVVVGGKLETRPQAEKVVSQLPAQLRRLSPWIRPVSDVKGSVLK